MPWGSTSGTSHAGPGAAEIEFGIGPPPPEFTTVGSSKRKCCIFLVVNPKGHRVNVVDSDLSAKRKDVYHVHPAAATRPGWDFPRITLDYLIVCHHNFQLYRRQMWNGKGGHLLWNYHPETTGVRLINRNGKTAPEVLYVSNQILVTAQLTRARLLGMRLCGGATATLKHCYRARNQNQE